MLNSKERIRLCCFHYYKLGHNGSEVKPKIWQALGKDVVSTKTAYHWFEHLRNRDFSLDDESKDKGVQPKWI